MRGGILRARDRIVHQDQLQVHLVTGVWEEMWQVGKAVSVETNTRQRDLNPIQHASQDPVVTEPLGFPVLPAMPQL